ncbi:MAG: hypothetical protein EAZ27_04445 [Cytophagales bacterium]|nr:MAG: hypothetical protein EAZ27_04445 [Cytophagales bacterium]
MITITNFAAGKKIVMREVESVSGKKGWSNLTNKATLTFAKNILFDKNDNIKLTEVISVGSTIEIELGYDGNLKQEFKGFITKINQTIPIKLECEDDMYVLKRKTLKPKTFENAELIDIVKYITEGTNYTLNVLPSHVGKFTIEGTNATSAIVLQYIKEKYGFATSFIRQNELTVGFPYQIESKGDTYVLDFGNNIVSHNLEFKTKEDTKLILKGTSHNKGKKPLKVDYNPQKALDSEAEKRDIPLDSNLTEEQALNRLKIEYEKVLIDGYSGDIVLFGIPFINTGDAVILKDPDFADRKGKYLTGDVEWSFSTAGYRRKVGITKQI